MTQWKIAIHSDQVPPQSPLSISPAEFSERLSPYSQGAAIRNKYLWQDWLQKELLWHALPVLALSECLACFLKRKMRRFFALFTVVSTCIVFLCIFSGPTLTAIYSGDIGYLNDYEYIPLQNWPSHPKAREPIVAYEKMSILEAERIVAFDSGRAARLREEEFQALAAAQGIVVAGSSGSE